MSEFWAGAICGIVLWVGFWWALKQLLVFLVLRIAKDKIAELKAAEDEILLTVEKHNDVIYCYRKDNNEFIGQASTLEEIGNLFKKKYPNNNGRILKEDANGLMQ
jgi:hypothetical protein